MQIAPVRN